jgi:hypothetical protein
MCLYYFYFEGLYFIYLHISFYSERTFVSERNEASGCASASIHSRTLTQDDVSNQSEVLLQCDKSCDRYSNQCFTFSLKFQSILIKGYFLGSEKINQFLWQRLNTWIELLEITNVCFIITSGISVVCLNICNDLAIDLER